MAFFGATIEIHVNNLLAHVTRIIEEANHKEKVYLISPYLQLNTNIGDAIEKALKNGVDIRLIFRKGYDLRDEERRFLINSSIQARELGHLHAKLYVSESEGLVTSLNLYNYSDKESRELGITVSDYKSVTKLQEIAEDWWEKADKVDRHSLLIGSSQMPKPESFTKKFETAKSVAGYCIRCGKPKSFNPKYPHCDDCYKKWAEYENPIYPEKHCHKCGASAKTSKKDPVCKKCA